MPASCRASTISTNSLVSRPGRGGIRGVRGEERQRGVAPVVRPTGRGQHGFRRVGVHREQFERGDVQRAQMFDDRRVADARVCATLVLGDRGMPPGEAGDVGLVDHGVFPRHVRARGTAADRLRDHAERRAGEGVDSGRRSRVEVVGSGVDPAGVRVEKDLGRVGGADPVAVPGPWCHSWYVGVPDAECLFLHRQPAFGAAGLDQAELDARRIRLPPRRSSCRRHPAWRPAGTACRGTGCRPCPSLPPDRSGGRSASGWGRPRAWSPQDCGGCRCASGAAGWSDGWGRMTGVSQPHEPADRARRSAGSRGTSLVAGAPA